MPGVRASKGPARGRLSRLVVGDPVNWMQWLWLRVIAYCLASRIEAATCSDGPLAPVTAGTLPSEA
jgi:hypothetical protein